MRVIRVPLYILQAQYVFIHDALSDVITCGDTRLVASELHNRVNALHEVHSQNGSSSGFEEQFEVYVTYQQCAHLGSLMWSPLDHLCGSSMWFHGITQKIGKIII